MLLCYCYKIVYMEPFNLKIKKQNYQMHSNTMENVTPLKQPSNPEFATPESSKKVLSFPIYEQTHFQQAKSMLHQGKVFEALDLFPPTSFIRELIIDHVEIHKIHQILMAQAGTVGFDDIKYDGKVFGAEREARLKGLHQLKRSKYLNNKLVNNVSNHLQDILLEQFEPLSSFNPSRSQIFIKLYQKLNQIQQKFDLFKNNSSEIPTFIRQKAEQVAVQNRNLQQQLGKAQQNVGKYQQEASKIMNENNNLKQILKVLRYSQNKHEKQKLNLQKDFNHQLQKKQEQYRQELLELKDKSNIPQRMKLMEKELDASIEDFKNLIYKLSLENKLLKEERDLLLTQLTRVYERFQVFITFYETTQDPEKEEIPPLSIGSQKDQHQQLQSRLITDLKGKLTELQVEIKDKNDVIQKIKDELQELRREKQCPISSELNRSISISSTESKEEKKLKKRYKRNKSGEQAVSKLTELEQLRRMDKELIQSLSVTVEELTEKIKTNHNISDDSEIKKKQPQETINTISSSVQCEQQKPDEGIIGIYSKIKAQQHEQMAKGIKKMKQKISLLEENLEQQRQTNASLNAILEDLQSFEKPKEDTSVLTPRMLTDIAELKENISSLSEKNNDLEKELHKVTQQKAELIKIYEDQVINLEFQCSEAQLEITTLENKIYDLEQKLTEKQNSTNSLTTPNDQQSNIQTQDEGLHQRQKQLQQQIIAKNEEIEALLAEEQSLKQKLEDVSSRLKSSQTMTNFLTTKNKEVQKKYKSIVTAKQFRQQYPKEIQHGLFYGDILQDKPFDKQFLIETLQKSSGKTLKKSKILWKHDPMNKTNFHQYIDNNENFVMLVELEDGYIVGGYSQGRLYPKMTSDRNGLLFSLTKKEVFELAELNKRAIVYDEYYVIFGNSELRIKSQENKLYSNFGINSGYYKSRGLKVDMITNSTDKEVSFKNVEIHQIEYL